MRRPYLVLSLLLVSLLVLGLLYLYHRRIELESRYPVPPDSYYITRLGEDFKCEKLLIKGTMPIRTTPEGLSLRGGLGIQFLCQYNPPEKTLVYVAFMKVSNERVAKEVAREIISYVNGSRDRYNEWVYDIGEGFGYAYFDYPGLRWELWYRGRWLIEVGTGRSGEEGAKIISHVKECIARIGRS